MHEGLDGNTHVTIHDYAGLDHGFADTFGARSERGWRGIGGEADGGVFRGECGLEDQRPASFITCGVTSCAPSQIILPAT